MSGFNDHGNAFKPQEFEPDYGPPPRFSLHSFDAEIGKLAYDMEREAKSAAIHAKRLVNLMETGFAREAMQRNQLSAAMEDCARSLAEAIERLTRKEAA